MDIQRIKIEINRAQGIALEKAFLNADSYHLGVIAYSPEDISYWLTHSNNNWAIEFVVIGDSCTPTNNVILPSFVFDTIKNKLFSGHLMEDRHTFVISPLIGGDPGIIIKKQNLVASIQSLRLKSKIRAAQYSRLKLVAH